LSNENTFTLTRDSIQEIADGIIYFKVADTPVNELSYYPFIEMIITENDTNILPIADFSTNITEGFASLPVQFVDLSQDASWRTWYFGDGANSTEQNPVHVYSKEGNYNVYLSVGNEYGTDSKNAWITVQQASSSGGSGGSSHKSSGGSSGSSGGGGSPEPQSNVEVKELSQAYVSSSQTTKFNFPKNVTSVVYICFDSKKTLGKTTTIAEMLKGKSALVSELPKGQTYKSINVWVGSGGVASAKNIENAVLCFKVDKGWVKDKTIDKDSIVLNRYTNKIWEQLPTNLLSEDEKYLYFTAKTQEFGSFAITGKQLEKENEGASPNKQTNSENNEEKQNNSSKPVTTEKNSEGKPEPKGNLKMPAFELSYGIVGLLVVFLCRRR